MDRLRTTTLYVYLPLLGLTIIKLPIVRWPIPDGPQSVFFQQSAILYATYYYIQILVHRPFIPRPGKPAPLTYPSLAICTNAARSCSQVLEEYLNNCDVGSAPFLMYYAFTSGLVLLLNIWGIRKQGDVEQGDRPMSDVHRCMRFLKVAQDRYVFIFEYLVNHF